MSKIKYERVNLADLDTSSSDDDDYGKLFSGRPPIRSRPPHFKTRKAGKKSCLGTLCFRVCLILGASSLFAAIFLSLAFYNQDADARSFWGNIQSSLVYFKNSTFTSSLNETSADVNQTTTETDLITDLVEKSATTTTPKKSTEESVTETPKTMKKSSAKPSIQTDVANQKTVEEQIIGGSMGRSFSILKSPPPSQTRAGSSFLSTDFSYSSGVDESSYF
eukprot:TRINITY_DN5201_c0_g1_i2.p1 TRINITY_DN5201_c0_g1~~TRINITY_DN5201_c0_g1_i2.p1  ORF type:complete len:220 (-),score=36.43 TRINITY_DN5201_c0_g1_i2:60-719(-)